MQGKLYGIGIGPGAADMVTIRAASILAKADVIAAPQKNGSPGIAYTIASVYACPQAKALSLDFPMTGDIQMLMQKWAAAALQIENELIKGYDVAFVTLGDVSTYSTYAYIRDIIIDKGYAVETVAGVPSFCAGAAEANVSLAEANERMAIVPFTDGMDGLDELLTQFESVVLMKVYKGYAGLIDVLEQKNLLEQTVVLRRIGMDGQQIAYGKEAKHITTADYFTTVLIHNTNGQKITR